MSHARQPITTMMITTITIITISSIAAVPAHRGRGTDPARGDRGRLHRHGAGGRGRRHHPLRQPGARRHASPGLAWKLPAPFESTIPIDLRLRTTSTGLQDVGTRDGLRVLVQAYVAWQVPSDPQHVRQFLRSVRNQPDEAARQLRSFVSAALHITSSNFDLTDLVNIDSQQGAAGSVRAAAARPGRRRACCRSTASRSGRWASSA